ncbi:MAG: histidine phosphatase family protein [Actinomycetota bacterium]
MRLLLIRHGQTIDNVNGVIAATVPGPGLTELGQQQAAAIPAALASEPIDAIYVSTMMRTRLTAEPLARARGLQIREIDGIQEINAGELEGHSDKDAIRTYMSTIYSWWNDFSARIPGGEDGNDFYSRFTSAVETIASAHSGTVALFSHGAAIRTWASWSSTNLDATFSRTHPLENTAVVVVEGSPSDGWVTTYWADEPVGGAALEDADAIDPTGEAG